MERRIGHCGFTLIEVLLSLALTAVLLVSVAAAIKAVTEGYKENIPITEATTAARFSLSKMMRNVRTADEISTSTNRLTILPPNDGNGLTQIEYNLANGALYYSCTVGGTTTSNVLIGGDNIQVTAFTLTPLTATMGTITYTKRLTATISLRIDDRDFTATSAAALRRNQEF